MKYSVGNIGLSCYWYNRSLTAKEYLAWVKEFIDKLRATSELFSTLYIVGRSPNKDTKIEDDTASIQKLAFENISRDVAYLNEDAKDKEVHLSSRCVMGFSNTLVTTLTPDVPGVLIEVRIGKHSKGVLNTVNLQVSDQLFEADALKHLFLEVVSFCRPVHAHCAPRWFGSMLAQPVGDIQVGWLTFLPIKLFDANLPAAARVESFLDGVVIQISDAPQSVEKDEDRALVQEVFSNLKSNGMLENPKRNFS